MRLMQEMYAKDVRIGQEFILDGTTYRMREVEQHFVIAKVTSDYYLTYDEAIEFLKDPHDNFPHKGDEMFLPARTIVISEVVTR
jgi:hypothetical protein